MRRLLREPLLHFFLLGALLFLVYGLRSDPARSGAPDVIVVTRGRIENLAASFARSWQRPPSETELKGLVDEWVRDEMAAREAIALGLDQEDPVIRRRLRQKLEFVSADLALRSEPSDAELETYLQAHPEAFRLPPRLSFEQVFLDPQLRGEELPREAEQLLLRLNQGSGIPDPTALGDPILLEPGYHAIAADQLADLFGAEFAAALLELEPGAWRGPVVSSYGQHLVRLNARADARLPALDEAREAVRREWTNAQRQAGNESFYQELLGRYTVKIEESAPPERGLAQ